MNKKYTKIPNAAVLLILVQILMLSLNCFAALSALAKKTANESKDEAQSVLFYRTKQGFEETLSFAIKEGEIQLPNKSVPMSDLVGHIDEVRQALRIENSPDRAPCEAGEYLHGVTINAQKRTEVGCLDDEHFSRLSAAFTAIDGL